VQYVFILVIRFKYCANKPRRLESTAFAESSSRQQYDLVPALVVHQRFQYLMAFALPQLVQFDGGEILLEGQVQEAVKPPPILIQSAFEKNTAEFGDVAAELRCSLVSSVFSQTRVDLSHRFDQQLAQFLFTDQTAGGRAMDMPGDG